MDNLLYLKWQEAIRDVWTVRDPYEERLFAERDSIDRIALDLYDSGHQKKAKAFLTEYSQSNMEEVLEMFNTLRDDLIVKYSNSR